jgi:hypothetical protein
MRKPTSENPDPSIRSGQAVGRPSGVGESGFSTHDETVSSFGRNDGSLGWVKSNDSGNGEKVNCRSDVLRVGAVAFFVFFAGAAGTWIVAANLFSGDARSVAVAAAG